MLGNEDRMKISTKGRYAVRVMLDLALNNNGECIKVKEIAARQGISEKYLEQIIAVLNKEERPWRPGRLPYRQRPGRLYGGNDPAADGRIAGTGGLSGRRCGHL